MITATDFEIAGHRKAKTLGVVRGITVRSRAAPLTVLGSLRSIFGGRIGIFANLCESARQEAFDLMIEHAKELGADAVVGVRYDSEPIFNTAEILCYGTAVTLEK